MGIKESFFLNLKFISPALMYLKVLLVVKLDFILPELNKEDQESRSTQEEVEEGIVVIIVIGMSSYELRENT
jgi:hypothetical protein